VSGVQGESMRLLLAGLVGVATAQDGTQCTPDYLAAIQQICCVSSRLLQQRAGSHPVARSLLCSLLSALLLESARASSFGERGGG
jgi:hypothetical protein